MVLWGIVEALLALSRRAWRAAAGHTALGDLGAAESFGELNIGVTFRSYLVTGRRDRAADS